MNKEQLLKKAKTLFGGEPYVVDYGRKFLVLAYRTKSKGEWHKLDEKTGEMEPINFTYLKRTVCASGRTWDSLWKAAKYFKSLGKHPKKKGCV